MAEAHEDRQSGIPAKRGTGYYGTVGIQSAMNAAGHLQDVGHNQVAAPSTMDQRMATGRYVCRSGREGIGGCSIPDGIANRAQQPAR